MKIDNIKQLDQIYVRYGYEIKENHKGARVYLFTKSIYNGADIIPISDDCDIDKLKNEFSAEGYAIKVRNFLTIQEAETTLFNDFFKIDTVKYSLKRRYDEFVERLKLPKGAIYQYIQSPYQYTSYTSDKDSGSYANHSKHSFSSGLVDRIKELIEIYQGPLFVIVEAAAGYGKTCTAYELLNEFIKDTHGKIPFFTELARDRRATIFSHILRKEIEEQFANRVDSKVVLHEIKEGRIPLIIDGFDELIAKDFSFSSSDFDQVESMLSTIVDLLNGNAKIIITSRKTAIFDSEDFHNWMSERNIEYSLAKITISEPQISDWLDNNRIDLLQEIRLPVEQFANPVLLSFLKYQNYEELISSIRDKKSVVESYILFMLGREQNRQSLLMEPETQLRIFRKLVRLFIELDIKVASKEDVKELLIAYNKKIFDETLKKYTPENRPRLDQLADTLSNHAFLDRKDNKYIGFVNEFIFGILIGQNLILNKFFEHNPKYFEDLNQHFALLAVQAFKAQSDQMKLELWNSFQNKDFYFDQEFFFIIDIELKKQLHSNLKHAAVDGFTIEVINFEGKDKIIETTFTNCKFKDCKFSILTFQKSAFVNCEFYNCSLTNNPKDYSSENFSLYGCWSDNYFISELLDNDMSIEIEVVEIDYDKLILGKYFIQGSLRPRHKLLSALRLELSDYNQKEVSKTIDKLERQGYLILNGNLSHLTKDGFRYFNEELKN